LQLRTLDFDFRINPTPAMSRGLDYKGVDYADACRRLRDNEVSLEALGFEIFFGSLSLKDFLATTSIMQLRLLKACATTPIFKD
jgi:hypothetical protein